MTTARERPTARRKPGWDERSLLSGHAGMRWWAAICLALGLTAVGVFIDVQRLNRLGTLFQACYFLGCLLAVILVQRKGLFGPMVQPPLILALAVPGVVLLAGPVPTGGSAATAALAVGTPLINGFPTMAITTGSTLALGFFRQFTQRPPAARAGAQTRDPATERAEQPPAEHVERRPATPDLEPMTKPVPRVTDPPPDRSNPRRRRHS